MSLLRKRKRTVQVLYQVAPLIILAFSHSDSLAWVFSMDLAGSETNLKRTGKSFMKGMPKGISFEDFFYFIALLKSEKKINKTRSLTFLFAPLPPAQPQPLHHF